MLCWNVYIGDFNKREIRLYNIFDNWTFYDSCVKAKRKFKEDRDGFAEEVRGWLQYYFWSKCEWEIILSQWPSGEVYEMRTKTTVGKLRDVVDYESRCSYMNPDREVTIRVYPNDCARREEKIDVYDQVYNNWDAFVEYLWNHRNELKARK